MNADGAPIPSAYNKQQGHSPNHKGSDNHTQLTGAALLVRALERLKVQTIFGMPGGAILPVYDELLKSSIRHVQARHEQAAGFMAQGWARSTGRPGVCIATSGPGATNLVTAIADAHMDSIPLVAITGQVPTALIGTQAFQETNITSMVSACTKAAFTIQSAEQIEPAVEAAFALAAEGRPGPVLIDLPKDVQKQWATPVQKKSATSGAYEPIASEFMTDALPGKLPASLIAKQADICAAAQELINAKRPILLVGGGAQDASSALRKFLEVQSIPSANTLMGIGVLKPGPLHLGMLGMHGSVAVNTALNECDLLLAVGVRFDDRATGKLNEFCPEAKVIHIDVEPSQIGRLKKIHIGLVGDADTVVRQLTNELVQVGQEARHVPTPWFNRVMRLNQEQALVPPHPPKDNCPIAFVRALGHTIAEGAIVTTDVGQHQMWLAQYLPRAEPRRFLTSGGLGTMGFGLTAAFGAALAANNDLEGQDVYCISGDGSFPLNIQELATVAEYQPNIKMIILDNQRLGLVSQQQNLFFEQRYSADRYRVNSNFAQIARAYGIKAEHCAADETSVWQKALAQPGPFLLHVVVNSDAQVLPMVPPGQANTTMITDSQKPVGV